MICGWKNQVDLLTEIHILQQGQGLFMRKNAKSYLIEFIWFIWRTFLKYWGRHPQTFSRTESDCKFSVRGSLMRTKNKGWHWFWQDLEEVVIWGLIRLLRRCQVDIVNLCNYQGMSSYVRFLSNFDNQRFIMAGAIKTAVAAMVLAEL